MTDRFGRNIDYMRISITDRCNLRCRYCMPEGVKYLGHSEILRYEELLEIAQIGKECHSHCEIFKKMRDCIMPREGVFARVLEPGTICVGDEMTLQPRRTPRPWQAAVITLSDRGAAGQREDESGPAIVRRLEEAGYDVVERPLIADDPELLKRHLIRLADQRQLDLILSRCRGKE